MHLKYILEDSGLCSPVMFCAESRIIITGRDRHVFENVKMKKCIYEVKQLNDYQALQLFRFYAFDPSSSQEEYEELSKKVVKYAQGLPLTLKVLGCELKGKSAEIWIDKLKKIEDIPPGNILGILRTSFDGLDRDEKRIFLDIACFFKGHAVKDVERILKCFDFYSTDGMDRLRDKSLISISQSFGTIEMHDLIQQMGQEIVVEESGQKIEKQSRLWKPKDIEYVLRTDRGTENVEAISLVLNEYEGPLNINSKAFINMHKLRFLRVFGSFGHDSKKVCLADGLEFLPNSLRCLIWWSFPLSCLPSSFSLDELVELDMPYNNLKELVWDKPPRNLKRICLPYSRDLIKISNLGEALNLEIIELSHHERMVEKLDSLITLDISSCTSLYKFPKVPYNTKELILPDNDEFEVPEPDLCEFSNLTSLLNTICNLRSKVKNLDVSFCKNLNMLPKDLGNLEFLEELKACGSDLKALPSSICNLRSLKYLDISCCNNLNKLPKNLRNLESLEELNADGSGLEELPDIPKNLKKLLAADCKSLKSVPARFTLPLSYLDLSNCEKLNEGASSTILQSLQESQYLSTYKCDLCIVGNEVPQWMKYHNSSGSSLSFEFDTHGHSICFIFCAVIVVIVAVDPCSHLWLRACLTDKCGNKKAYFSRRMPLHSNLEHVIVWHGQFDHSARGASFEIFSDRDEDWSKIKSIGVHPIVERGDDRKRKREEEKGGEESNSDLNLNLSLSLPHSS